MPRFKVEYEDSLNEVLKSLGMAEAFDPARANFSAIAELKGQNFYISEVKHKAFAEVNEEGTERALCSLWVPLRIRSRNTDEDGSIRLQSV